MGRPPSCGPCCATFACDDNCGDTLSVDWTFSVAGVTDDLCSGCSDLNRTWTLLGSSGWKEDLLAVQPCGVPSFAQLKCDDQPTFNVPKLLFHFGVSDNAIYTKNGTLDCCNDNIFTLFSVIAADRCVGWPATLTLTPTGGSC